MPHPPVLIYGANGYSAKLIVDELLKIGIKPILSGRNKIKISEAADNAGLSYRIFSLDTRSEIESNLKDIHTILNCAGPFEFTAAPLLEACLNTRTNYLDINGEIPVIEHAWSLNEIAIEKGIVIIPSVGFDVIPSDCLAARLSKKMPDADYLKIGFVNSGGISRGTWLTTIGMLRRNGKIRRGGEIMDVPLAGDKIMLKVGAVKFKGVSIPWGDVASAYHSTGIPDIEVFLGLNPVLFYSRRILFPLLNIFKVEWAARLFSRIIASSVTGPGEKARNRTQILLWCLIGKNSGKEILEAYRFIEGYTLTAKGSAAAIESLLNKNIPPGTKTPSLAFGDDFMNDYIIERIDEVNRWNPFRPLYFRRNHI